MNKCHCGASATVYLAYSNKHLCAPHFIRMFDKRFRKTIRQFKMIQKGERIAVGLSGGKDSTVLLHSLAALNKDLPFDMVAVTIDEGIKNYRERTLEIAKKECERLGIEHQIFSYKKEAHTTMDEVVEKRPDDIPCSHCGILRRYLLNKAAREVGANKLATGHNLDDTAQTVLMNIMKNEPSRLARFNEPLIKNASFIQRIKPLIVTPEREIAIYAVLKNIELERIECPYAKWAFRGQIRRILNEMEEKYPGTKFKIANSFLEIEDALRSKYIGKKEELKKCSECGEPTSRPVCMFCTTVKLLKNSDVTSESEKLML